MLFLSENQLRFIWIGRRTRDDDKIFVVILSINLEHLHKFILEIIHSLIF